MLKKLFSHTILYSLGPILPKLAMVLALPWLTQHLSATDFGVMGVVGATAGALQALAALGLQVVLVNAFYHSPLRFKELWRSLYGFLSVWTWAYALLVCGAILAVLPAEAGEHRWLICLLHLHVLFFGQGALLGTTLLQLRQRPWPVAWRALLFGLVQVGLLLYLVVERELGYLGWFGAVFVGTALSNLSYGPFLWGEERLLPRWGFKWRHVRARLRVSLPLLPHYYSSYLLDASDRLVMRLFGVPTALIGRYNAAYQFGGYFQMLGLTSANAIGPLMMEQYKKGNDAAARDLVFALMAVFMAGTFVAALWMKELFGLLLRNAELAAMYPLGVVIVMGYAYRPMYFGANNKLFLAERTHLIWRVSVVAGLGNVAMNLVAVPLFGYQAAAYTTFASLLYMGFSGYFFPVFKELNSAEYYPLRWLAGLVGLTALAYWGVEWFWGWKLGVSAVAGALALAGLRRLRP